MPTHGHFSVGLPQYAGRTVTVCDWVAYKQQKLIFFSSKGWKSKISADRFGVW